MEQLTDLGSVLRIAKRRALYFIVPAVVISAAGSAIVMFLPAIYRSQATILVESQQIPSELVQSTVTAMADERLQVIQQRTLSRDNLLGLAKKFSLFQGDEDLSPTELADLVKSRIQIVPVNAAGTGRRVASDRLVIAFTVAYEDESAQRAAGVANELVTTILSADARTRVAQAAETSKFLDDESKRLSTKLSEVEAEISRTRLQSADALPEKLAFNMSVNERLEKNITEVDRELQGIAEQKRLLAFEATVKKATASGGVLRPTAQNDLALRIDALKADIATKSAVYSETHPEMKALRKTLAALEAELKQPANVVTTSAEPGTTSTNVLSDLEAQLVSEKMAALDGRIAFLDKQREEYSKASLALKDVISRTPDVAAVLSALERQRNGIQKSLDDVGDKLAKARLGEKLEEDQRSERFEVIEQPIVPSDPSRPDRKKFLALVIAGALGAGGGLAAVTEFLDRRIRTSADMLARVGVRPLAVIEFIALTGEKRRKLWLTILIVALLVLLIAGALFAVDYYYMPLEMVFQKIIDRLNI